jgi:hypothetical protein
MRAYRWLLAGLTLSLFAGSTLAQTDGGNLHYRWVDAKGGVQISDSISQEAINQGYVAINARGLVVGHVPRALTADEREAANKLAQENEVKARAIADQKKADDQFLNAYPTEKEVGIFHQQTLSGIDTQINTTQMNLKSQSVSLQTMVEQAASFDNIKKPVPKFLADQIKKQQGVVEGQETTLKRQQATRAQTVIAQQAEMVHYRGLLSTRAAEQAASTSSSAAPAH